MLTQRGQPAAATINSPINNALLSLSVVHISGDEGFVCVREADPVLFCEDVGDTDELLKLIIEKQSNRIEFNKNSYN